MVAESWNPTKLRRDMNPPEMQPPTRDIKVMLGATLSTDSSDEGGLNRNYVAALV